MSIFLEPPRLRIGEDSEVFGKSLLPVVIIGLVAVVSAVQVVQDLYQSRPTTRLIDPEVSHLAIQNSSYQELEISLSLNHRQCYPPLPSIRFPNPFAKFVCEECPLHAKAKQFSQRSPNARKGRSLTISVSLIALGLLEVSFGSDRRNET